MDRSTIHHQNDTVSYRSYLVRAWRWICKPSNALFGFQFDRWLRLLLCHSFSSFLRKQLVASHCNRKPTLKPGVEFKKKNRITVLYKAVTPLCRIWHVLHRKFDGLHQRSFLIILHSFILLKVPRCRHPSICNSAYSIDTHCITCLWQICVDCSCAWTVMATKVLLGRTQNRFLQLFRDINTYE